MDLPTNEQISEVLELMSRNKKSDGLVPAYALDYKIKIFLISKSLKMFSSALTEQADIWSVDFAEIPTPCLGRQITTLAEWADKLDRAAELLDKAVKVLYPEYHTFAGRIRNIEAEEAVFETQLADIRCLMEPLSITDSELESLSK